MGIAGSGSYIARPIHPVPHSGPLPTTTSLSSPGGILWAKKGLRPLAILGPGPPGDGVEVGREEKERPLCRGIAGGGLGLIFRALCGPVIPPPCLDWRHLPHHWGSLMRSPGNRVRDGHKGVLVTQGLEDVTEHTLEIQSP